MTRLRIAWLLPALLILAASPARSGAFIKGGAFFGADDLTVDTSNSHWIAGVGSDSWVSEVFALGFEVDFTHTSSEALLSDDDIDTFYIYPYITAKFRIPTDGFQLYAGGGIGYSPIITTREEEAHQVGGLGYQFVGGISFADLMDTGLFIEAQYKVTDVNDDEGRLFVPQNGSYDLFLLVGGIHF